MNKTIPLLLLIALFGAAGWYFFTAKPSAVHELPPPQIEPVEKPAPKPAPPVTEPAPAEEAAAEEPLPQLNASDGAVKQALDHIAGDSTVSAYLVKNNVISRLVVAIDSLTGRQVPTGVNPLRAVGGSLKTEVKDGRTVLSAENFARYDGYVKALQKLDDDKLIAVYRRFYPLIQQAWEKSGGEGDFNERLLQVIDSLQQTPEVAPPIYLLKPGSVYVFEDPKLEALTAGQKILIRMGRANAAAVKDKLDDLGRKLAGDESPD